jgi:hypothetical protein
VSLLNIITTGNDSCKTVFGFESTVTMSYGRQKKEHSAGLLCDAILDNDYE